jgi:hypothetical protein
LFFIHAKNTGGRAENGTLWTRATAPHNTTVVSTQHDFNMIKMTSALPFAMHSVRVSRIATAEQTGLRSGTLTLPSLEQSNMLFMLTIFRFFG